MREILEPFWRGVTAAILAQNAAATKDQPLPDNVRWKPTGRLRQRLPKGESTPQLEQEYTNVVGDTQWRPVETVIDENGDPSNPPNQGSAGKPRAN